MIRELVHDPFLLSKKSEKASKNDESIAADLLDTLKAYSRTCVGMAANMIGEYKQIIAFFDNGKPIVMYNPEIVTASGEYQTEEGCLSLLGGTRKAKRYRKITIRFADEHFRLRTKTYSGITAQVIQHELDHCGGILI